MVDTAIFAGWVAEHVVTVKFPWNSFAKTRYSRPTSNGYPHASVPLSVRITRESPELPRKRSDTPNVTLTRPHASGCGSGVGDRVALFAGLAFGYRTPGAAPFWVSLAATVATTITSAVGTGQLLMPPPAQEQAAAGKANRGNVATIEPIRRRIPTLQSITRRFRQIEIVTCSGRWAAGG